MEAVQFLKTAMRDRFVGAMLPTSTPCVRKVCRSIDRHRPVTVVEFGPGSGAFTKHLVRTLCPGSLVIAIETNPEFVTSLREQSERWVTGVRLEVVQDDARNVLNVLRSFGIPKADCILSGIPFSMIDPSIRREIVVASRGALVDDGQMIVYQYTYQIVPILRECFQDIQLARSLRNFPPMCLMTARVSSAAMLPPKVRRKSLKAALFVHARER